MNIPTAYRAGLGCHACQFGFREPRCSTSAASAALSLTAEVVSGTPKSSLGVHSKAVHNAASVSNFTWLGFLFSNAETDGEDSSSPARSASRRRSCAPVHTSRAAITCRSLQPICTRSRLPAFGVRARGTSISVRRSVSLIQAERSAWCPRRVRSATGTWKAWLIKVRLYLYVRGATFRAVGPRDCLVVEPVASAGRR